MTDFTKSLLVPTFLFGWVPVYFVIHWLTKKLTKLDPVHTSVLTTGVIWLFILAIIGSTLAV